MLATDELDDDVVRRRCIGAAAIGAVVEREGNDRDHPSPSRWCTGPVGYPTEIASLPVDSTTVGYRCG